MSSKKIREDQETIQLYLRQSDWWRSGDACETLARIIDRYGLFSSTGAVIDYFEKPWKFEPALQTILEFH